MDITPFIELLVTQSATNATTDILIDINRRRGYDSLWDELDDDVREGVTYAIFECIQSEMTLLLNRQDGIKQLLQGDIELKLNELKESPKGTYAGVRFDTATNKAIHQYMKDNDIPNAIRADKLHITLLYSRKYLPNYKPLGKIEPPMIAKPTEFVVWNTKPENPNDKPARCLVVKLDCPDLVARHNKLMKEYGATYDFDKYEVHVTLSYDIGDMDIDHLPKLSDTIKELKIVEEYSEDLDLDWAKNKGSKK